MKIEKTAIVIKTGKQIRVCKNRETGLWTDKQDYITTYKPEQLNIIN